MTASQQRRRNPQPIGQGWETAVAILGSAILVLGLTALCGLGAASALFGRGWVWPSGTEAMGHVIGGLVTGRPGQGFGDRQAALVAGPVAVYLCVAVCELAAIAASITGAVLVTRYRRPGDARGGMATRSEAEQVLGISRLRAARAIIRPDLHGAKASKGNG